MNVMASWLVLPYFALYSCVLVSITGTATLSVDRAHSCPGTKIVFTCVVNTTVLSWDIDFLNGNNINRVLFFPSDHIGRQFEISPQTSQGTVYIFNLTSKSPLTSTMTTNASAELSGATVLCQDGYGSANMETLVVEIVAEPQKPNNVTVVMPLIHNSYDTADVLNITLEWNDESNSFPLKHRNHIFNYTITVQCSEATDSESVIFYTADTSIPLTLHYDRDYNISVVANNCVGNSTPAEIHIRLVYCGSSVGRDVSSSTRGNQVDDLKTYCLHSQPGLGFAPEESKPNKSTLLDDCSKNGSIHHHNSLRSVSKILVPVLTASHLLLSSCTLIIGLLLGSCSHRCCRKKVEFSTDKKLAEEPVYSEIPPKAVPPVCHLSELVKSVDNVAYGQVSP